MGGLKFFVLLKARIKKGIQNRPIIKMEKQPGETVGLVGVLTLGSAPRRNLLNICVILKAYCYLKDCNVGYTNLGSEPKKAVEHRCQNAGVYEVRSTVHRPRYNH